MKKICLQTHFPHYQFLKAFLSLICDHGLCSFTSPCHSEILYRIQIEKIIEFCHIFHNSFQIYEAKGHDGCISTEVYTGIVQKCADSTVVQYETQSTVKTCLVKK